jgi:hypothetical protein
MTGTYNCASLEAVTNKEFMRIPRKATGRGFGLSMYKWMILIGPFIIGTSPELD